MHSEIAIASTALIHKYTKTQVQKYTHTHTQKNTEIHTHTHKTHHTTLYMHSAPNAMGLHLVKLQLPPLHNYRNIQIHKYTNTQIHKYTNAQIYK